jgi:hypothetical protein
LRSQTALIDTKAAATLQPYAPFFYIFYFYLHPLYSFRITSTFEVAVTTSANRQNSFLVLAAFGRLLAGMPAHKQKHACK